MLKHTRCLHYVGVGLFLTVSSSVHAAGFAIIENSAAGMGNAFAGAAATASDASTVWFNPAGMTRFSKKQVSGALHVLDINSDFTNKGSRLNPKVGGTAIDGGDGDASLVLAVPNLYYIHPLNNDLVLGLGLNAPFGLETNYDDDWVGRYQAIQSKIITFNINPSLAWKASDKWSFGGGIDFQYIDVILSNAVDSGTICFASAPTTAAQANCAALGLTPGNSDKDGFAEVTGDNWAVGFNLGLLYEPNERTTIGLSYRAAIEQEVEGDATFKNDPSLQAVLDSLGSTAFQNSDITAVASLPAMMSLSLSQKVNAKINLLADITWTQWSLFEELRIDFDNEAQPDSVTTEAWNDVFRYSIGMDYQHSDKWLLRTGVAYDESPIPNVERRTPRIPGNERIWLSAGTRYVLSNTISLDFGYSHLFVDETPLDHTDEGLGHTTSGLYDSSVNIFSAQLNWTFE